MCGAQPRARRIPSTQSTLQNRLQAWLATGFFFGLYVFFSGSGAVNAVKPFGNNHKSCQAGPAVSATDGHIAMTNL
jgi:hypothetical protein